MITISSPVTINGNEKTITGASNLDPVFVIDENINVIINNLKFKDNTISNDGLISNNGYLEINGCEFINNSAIPPYDAGAIFSSIGSSLKLYNSNFTNNTARYGGAIYYESDEKLIIENCNFINNSAYYKDDYWDEYDGDGGAIYVSVSAIGGECDVYINNSYFINNSANEFGGAIYKNKNGNLFINNSHFIDNKVSNSDEYMDSYGGAIYQYGEKDDGRFCNLYVSNSEFKADLSIAILTSSVETEIEEEKYPIELILFRARNILEEILLQAQLKIQVAKNDLILNLRDDLEDAAKIANIEDDIADVKDKMDTVIGALEGKIEAEKEELNEKYGDE